MSLPPVTLDRTATWDVDTTGGTIRVAAAWPEQAPPPSGYPALFVLDGPSIFATAVEAARLQSGRPAATGVGPAVIVGLGHPGDKAAQAAARRRDYTPPPFDPASQTGGAGRFLRIMREVVLPAVQQVAPIDRGRLSLFGHSIAGLLPLHALLDGGHGFRCCIAASPSLWWGDGVLLDQARRWAAGPRGGTPCRLLLTVGGLERPDPAGPAERAQRMEQRRMVGNVRALADILAATVAVQHVEFPGENHGSVLPAAISRAIPFALGGVA